MENTKTIWICPADKTYNSGNFCIRCGRPRPAEYEPSGEEETEKEEIMAESESVPAEPLESAEGRSCPPEDTAAKKEKTAREKKAARKPILKGIRENIGEFFGDVAARFSRLELVEDIKADRKNRNIAIGVALSVMVILFLVFGLVIAPKMGICVLGHRWAESDCTDPMTCTVCGKQKSNPIPHDFSPATCTEPEKCRVCGETRGEALGHDWAEATCTEASVCRVCGIHSGESKGHVPGETVVKTAPTVMEPGEEEVICSVCGKVMETHPCELESYVDGDVYAFTVLEYSKLLKDRREKVLPEISMLVYNEKADCDCFAFWLGDNTDATLKAANCMLYDNNLDILPINEENYEKRPAAVRWTFTNAGDTETIKKIVPYILSTVSPEAINEETLMSEKVLCDDGLRYIYENDGSKCVLTILTFYAYDNGASSKLLGWG